jgi:hypothetical protein
MYEIVVLFCVNFICHIDGRMLFEKRPESGSGTKVEKLRNEELKFCCSPGVISVIRGSIMRWVGHAAKR